MNAALNGLGSQLFGWFGQLSIELAALAILVLVACRLLPIKSPALRHLLWAVVLLKPLVAIAISSPYTLFTPLVSLVEPSRDALASLPVDHSTVQVAASPAIATSSVQLTTAGWGAILWLVGAALLIGRILVGYGIVWCLRQQAQVQHDGPLCDALQQARRTLDCYPKVEVAISPSIGSPMALGILRPIIVFPADLVEKLSADKLALILMHELAHVRRWDNLTLLLHRLVSAVLFFHPAVWLCGRMLRRQAEQACDDLVVCATGRSEAYARSLAHVAERAAHLNPLMRGIPTMNAFAATESDLAQRIRRALGGGVRRMGMRARVLTAVLLCLLAAVTLPSVSKISAEPNQDERLSVVVDQNGNMKLNDKPVTFATLKEELQAKRRLLDNTTMIIIQGDERDTHSQIARIMDFARQIGIVDQVIATDSAESNQDERLSIVVDQNGNMKLNDKSVTFATLKEELQAQRRLLDNTTMIIIQGDEHATHAQIARIMDFARQVGIVDQIIATEPQPAKDKGAAKPSRDDGIWRKAMSTDPDEWSNELKAQLLALHHPGSTIEEIAEEVRRMVFVEAVRQRMPWQEAPGPDEWPEELKAKLRALKPITPTISYEIATATSAELAIYDVAGWHVRTFVLGHQNPGNYIIAWDGRDDAGRELSNGMYFYRLKTGGEEELVGKTILVK